MDKHLSAAGGGGASKKSKTVPLILILDELDYLVTRKQSVIYNLFEWATRGTSALIVVGISNTMDLPERLLPRVHSRLGIRRVNFLPYDRIALASIIADRLGGLAAFEADGVELCSRKVASVSGDVRRALEVCRSRRRSPSATTSRRATNSRPRRSRLGAARRGRARRRCTGSSTSSSATSMKRRSSCGGRA